MEGVDIFRLLVRGAGLDARTIQSPANRGASALMGGSGSAMIMIVMIVADITQLQWHYSATLPN
jgi:hypothetical protein